MPPITQLQALITLWINSGNKEFALYRQAIQATEAGTPFPPYPIPANLLATLTYREPYRQQAVEQAGQWLYTPWLYGIGMELHLDSNLSPEPFGPWQQTIAPLNFRLEWCRDMGCREIDTASGSIQRVVIEDNQWRIAQFY